MKPVKDTTKAIVEEDYEKDTEVVVEEKVEVTKYSIKGLSKDHPAQRDFNEFMQKQKGGKVRM